MAAQIPLKMPELVRQVGNLMTQRPVAPDSTNTFKANALVVLTAGVLTLVATGEVLVYGAVPDKSNAAGLILPDAFFGENHWVFSPVECEFEINVAALSANEPVIGASAKTLADVVLGAKYGIATATAGIYAGMQFLDPTNTTNLLFQVTALPGLTDPTYLPSFGVAGDYNPRVRVKLVPSTIQN